ncbi:DUF1761 domain-containing protein [Tabrizicola sp.]|uniref:DUF1761 domain-containing protein n=1 Tax=Tabrizicola sp. TaxID=2005166 RepID=UPI00286D3CE3|nr:DUF1761 domain-containing protein [Tabrizicola sp.]
MEILNVIAAAVGAFAFGAVWYMTMSKAWISAAEVAVDDKGRPMRQDSAGSGNSPMPFVIGIIAMIVVAGMMRHVFAMSGIVSLGSGIVAGAGIGAFFVLPWLAMNYAFAMRKPALTLIDGVNVVVGCTIMGAILELF